MARWVGLLLLAVGCAAPASADAPRPAAVAEASCVGEGTARRCTVAAIQGFPDNRGGLSALTVNAVRDAQCTTLHIVFDRPIALDRPVLLTVEGAGTQGFYTPAELTGLARALDGDRDGDGDGDGGPDRAPPEFLDFLALAATGALGEAEAGAEMIRRFAAVKEARRVGLTCGPMERLLPPIRAGRASRLEFQVESPTAARVYHWPRLDRRVVDLHLEGLLAALDRAMPGS